MTPTSLARLIDKFSGVRVLCVGDIMLDQFQYGTVSRISPEAPIPVLRKGRTMDMLGAVGNVARNVSSLGAQASVVALVGEDDAGQRLAEILNSDARLTNHLLNTTERPTTIKTRFIAGNQQLLRVDEEVVEAVDAGLEKQAIERLQALIPEHDCILISDYGKGFLSDQIIDFLVTEARNRQIPVITDPKGTDFAKYRAVSVLKPNASELQAATSLPTQTNADIENALSAALEATEAETIIVTRSEKGLAIGGRGSAPHYLQGRAREVYDVSGAGDTSLAALGLGVTVAGDVLVAAELAVLASGIVVGKAGTATVLPEELLLAARRDFQGSGLNEEVDSHDPYQRIEQWRRQGLRIGFTNGCFDILHPGHVSLLSYARQACDRLVVGLNSDASVYRLKGSARPVNTERARSAVLEGLKSVDLVLTFEEDTPARLIEQVQPDVLVKGGDYRKDEIVGADVVEGRGGEVLIAPLIAGHSTTSIIERSTK